ncbi:MAG TPA: glycosyltransferase, partial [Anaerolineaceae bacterium]|nr:glycosyltransferase [Anaerolineaceae bacterium]
MGRALPLADRFRPGSHPLLPDPAQWGVVQITPLRIPLLTYGTRGDVQPFFALAQGLLKSGHAPIVAAPERMADLAQQAGVPFHPLPGEPADFARAIVDQAGNNPYRIWQVGREFTFGLASQVMRELRHVCQDADLIVHTFLLTTGGHAMAREQNIPDISAQFFPIFAPTGDFASPPLPSLPLGRGYNRLTHHLFKFFYWRLGHMGYASIARRDRALPQRIYWPFERKNPWITPQLFGFSPLLVPQPMDCTARQHVTGFWQLQD